MSHRTVYFNGRFVPEAEARVSIFDSALMYGDMAFEMTRTYNHRPYKLREHLDRLYGPLRLLEIECGLSLDDEIFCTATTYALVHAAAFEGQVIGNGEPGPVFSRLLDAWKQSVGVDFVAQARDYAERLPGWERQQESTTQSR